MGEKPAAPSSVSRACNMRRGHVHGASARRSRKAARCWRARFSKGSSLSKKAWLADHLTRETRLRPIEEAFSRAGECAPERGRHARLCADDVLDQVGDRVDRARVAAHHRIEGVPVLAPVRPLVEETDGDEVVVRHLVRVKGGA